jgi:acetyl-CoA C-acetyltransferase
VVLMRESTAIERGLAPLARVLAYASHAQDPAWFTTAPSGAICKVLTRLGWTSADADLYEINEAFATVAMAAIRDLGLDRARVNVSGGACALGHPIGATGARIVTTLVHALRRRHARRGIASLCIGGGEAVAMALEIPPAAREG